MLFRSNTLGGSGDTSKPATAISLKHTKIDTTTVNALRYLPTTTQIYTPNQLDGFMNNGIGSNTLLGSGVYSYIL